MRYQWFLSYLRTLTENYSHIKIPNIKDEHYSAVERIPNAFITLLDHILPVVNKNIALFCNSDNQVMILFGLQPSISMYYEIEGNEHFCCSLDYYLCSSEEYETGQHSHNHTLSIMVDFTNGQILTGEDYVDSYNVNHRKNVTPIGNIPIEALDNAWRGLSNCLDDESMAVKEKHLKGYQQVKASHRLNCDKATKHTSTDPINSKARQKKPSKTSSLETLGTDSFFYKKMPYSRYDNCGYSDAITSESKLRKTDNQVLVDCKDISAARQSFRRST